MTRESLQRRAQRGFVEYEPVRIVLSRRARVRTTTGGWRTIPDAELDPQTVTIVPINALTAPARIPGDGADERFDYVVVASLDTDISKDDTFAYRGGTYRVVVVYPVTASVLYAGVVAHGA